METVVTYPMLIDAVHEALKQAEPPGGELCSDVGGFTSPRIRRFLNALVKRTCKHGAHLEVGCHRGATLLSAMYNNRAAKAWALDNFSDTLTEPSACLALALSENLRKYETRVGKIVFLRQDFFEWNWHQLCRMITCFYDGHHGYEQQKEAVTRAATWAKEPYVMVIDDFDHDDAVSGTIDGLGVLRGTGRDYTLLTRAGVDGWHEGLGIAIISQLPTE